MLKAVAWRYIGEVQILRGDNDFVPPFDKENQETPSLRSLKDWINPEKSPAFKKTNVASIIVGLEEDKPWIAVSFTCILLIYNVVRGYVTIRVSALRDAEERSLHAPDKHDYLQLYKLHYFFLQWLMWGAILVAIYNASILLLSVVYLPRS